MIYCGCQLILNENMPKNRIAVLGPAGIMFIDGIEPTYHYNVPMNYKDLTSHDKKEILVFRDFLAHVGSPGDYKNLPEPWQGYCDGTWSAQDMCWRDYLGFEGDDG